MYCAGGRRRGVQVCFREFTEEFLAATVKDELELGSIEVHSRLTKHIPFHPRALKPPQAPGPYELDR